MSKRLECKRAPVIVTKKKKEVTFDCTVGDEKYDGVDDVRLFSAMAGIKKEVDEPEHLVAILEKGAECQEISAKDKKILECYDAAHKKKRERLDDGDRDCISDESEEC
jgi:hypothetical protein